MSEFNVGDHVSYRIPGPGGQSANTGEGVVIGHTFPDVCVLASEQYIGMPINEAHCTRIGTEPRAQAWRQRYLANDWPLLEPQP